MTREVRLYLQDIIDFITRIQYFRSGFAYVGKTTFFNGRGWGLYRRHKASYSCGDSIPA